MSFTSFTMNVLTELVQRMKSPRILYSRLIEEDEEVTKDDRIVISTLNKRKEDFALKTVEEALEKRTNQDFQPAINIVDKMNSRFSRGSTKWNCMIRTISSPGYNHKVFCDNFIKINQDGLCVFIFRK